MTRAEEKALELFPVKKVPYYGLAIGAYSERDANSDKRALFCMGYEVAEKDLGWHSVEESLPPVDEEVIALTNEMNGHELPDASHLCFAHLVDRRYAMDYNGWNIPGVKYWMYCPELPEK